MIEDGYLYVDKTWQITGKYLFLFRPRRFGKLLLVSTLYDFGNQFLFKGLSIYDKIDWQSYLIIRWDFSVINHSTDTKLR